MTSSDFVFATVSMLGLLVKQDTCIVNSQLATIPTWNSDVVVLILVLCVSTLRALPRPWERTTQKSSVHSESAIQFEPESHSHLITAHHSYAFINSGEG